MGRQAPMGDFKIAPIDDAISRKLIPCISQNSYRFIAANK